MDKAQLNARYLFIRHDHDEPRPRPETKENCGACVLRGYGERKNGKPYMPNYAGWARVYVQAGEPIPEKWREGFEAERRSGNKAYAEALEADIEKYGVVFR